MDVTNGLEKTALGLNVFTALGKSMVGQRRSGRWASNILTRKTIREITGLDSTPIRKKKWLQPQKEKRFRAKMFSTPEQSKN